MSNFFKEFNKVSNSDWHAKLLADLKGKSEDLLNVSEPIEEITIKGYQHPDNAHSIDNPGTFPFTRGMSKQDNSWKNGVFIEIEDEKFANKKALNKLMTGADLLIFKSAKKKVDWKIVLDDIQFQFINIQFEIDNYEDYLTISEITKTAYSNVQFNFDFMSRNKELLTKIASNHQTEKQQPFCLVDAFQVQQCGASTWQEIAFALNVGHEYLLKLMDAGLAIDEAAACLSFRLGVGANYLFEIAKFRAFRRLWSNIIHAYHPKHNCSYNTRVTAMIGHLNKSLKDPYTNLLRQTTESMSALSGGVDNIVVLPYDHLSTEENTDLSERMAMNIPLILKEESYFDKVIDPIGGSYNLELLTDKIAVKAWNSFQKIEADGGLFNSEAQKNFTQSVSEKAKQRIQQFESGERILIGVNKFPSPQEKTPNWKAPNTYLGMNQLILEIAKNSTAV